jgi:hypothetical protein
LKVAQDAVDRAVKAKYDPIKEEIEIKKANLELLLKSPKLTADERTRAEAQKKKLEAEEKAITVPAEKDKKQQEVAAAKQAARAKKRAAQKENMLAAGIHPAEISMGKVHMSDMRSAQRLGSIFPTTCLQRTLC